MAKKFNLKILTPRNTFFSQDVDEINIEIANGYIGILPNHTPIISSIKPSTFLIKPDKKGKVDGIIGGGILYFYENELKIFTTNIIWVSQIEKTKAKTEISKINNRLLQKDISDFEKKRLTNLLKYYELQL
ncbi:MAG: ATP synthase epsilon chain [Candidatus Hepatoplasma vulgare]|nr:MAG: ATP synthase epsilon chain [Candidatus Hepatoplasma sp.]